MNTVKVKTDELLDRALDYAVALCQGGTSFQYDTVGTYWITIDGKDRALSRGWAQSFAPSTNWAHGGPIIEREWLEVVPWPNESNEYYRWSCVTRNDPSGVHRYGRTPLIAAMRCYVASKLGSEVEVPVGLLR